METVPLQAPPADVIIKKEGRPVHAGTPSFIPVQQISRLEKTLVWWAIRLRIFWFACTILKKPRLVLKTFRTMLRLRTNVWGGDLKKIYRVDGKYYFNMYTPAWPSAAYDALIKSELRRQEDPLNVRERLSFVFFAITRKCPLRCEHCFEWDNLNQKESFTKEELLATVDLFRREGVLQFHFSGGEPMVRIKELREVVRHTSANTECWVLTSGFNLTPENARALKQDGCKGIVISIDHYLPEVHNLFRGSDASFGHAVNGVAAARAAGLVVAISVCATRTFIEQGHLLPYIEFAKSIGVHFVQVLEPKNVGHYQDKDVLLFPRHIDELDRVFKLVNHSPAYQQYPTILYHGYHQRRVGCFSGSRSVYVDAAGDVHACPFCHTKSYNIIEHIRQGKQKLPEKENACPRYDKIA
ncbi:MAG TPA: radical SAM protein [Chitinophagaceae bacterium]|nr:radical SAM protein [Chitinophagaceae bacterium]